MASDVVGARAAQIVWAQILALVLAGVATQAQTCAGRIAYTYNAPGAFHDVCLMDEDGGNVVNLTNSPSTYDSLQFWSPDGRQIAFVSDRGGSQRFEEREIYVMDADGGGVRQVSHMGHCEGGCWSPDGKRIAVSCGDNREFDVFAMDADGGNVVQLTSSPGHDLCPAWPPHGEYVAFLSERTGAYAVYRCSLDGWDVEMMFDLPGQAYLTGLSFSPDGSRVAFCYASEVYDPFASDHSPGSWSTLYVADLDGSNRQQLTHGNRIDMSASWSPDGQRIVFESFLYGEQYSDLWDLDIFVVNADGTGLRNLTNSPLLDQGVPAWCPLLGASSAVGASSWGRLKLGRLGVGE